MDGNKMQEMMSAVSELRNTFEKTSSKVGSLEGKFNELDGLDKNKVNKLNETLDKFETINQELIKQKEADRVEKEAFEKKFAALSADNSELIKTLAYQSQNKNFNSDGVSNEIESTFAKLIKFEKEDIAANYKEALSKFEEAASNATVRTDINPKGGYLVHSSIANKIFKEASEISQLEQFCSNFSSNSKSLIIPIDREEDTDKTYFVNEAMEGEEETTSFDQKEVTSYRQSVTIPVTRDQLMFSDRDITSLIISKTADKLGKGASRAYLRGSHKNEPEGIMTSDKIRSVDSSAANTLDFDDIISLPIADGMKSAYADPSRSRYYFNLRTLYLLRTLKDNNGQYLWAPAVDAKAPATINGFNYALVSEMDDIAQGKYPVLFGDLRQAYAVLKTAGLSMIRDEYSNKKKAIVEFTFDRWLGGKVILNEAVRKLKIKS